MSKLTKKEIESEKAIITEKRNDDRTQWVKMMQGRKKLIDELGSDDGKRKFIELNS